MLILGTFFLTCVAWVLFRAKTLSDAWYIYAHWTQDWNWNALATANFSVRQFFPAIASVLVLESIQAINRHVPLGEKVTRLPTPLRWPAYAGFIFAVILFGVYRSNQFIYFQF